MTGPSTRQRRAWTAVVFLAVAVGGAAIQVRGALVPSFQTTFGVSESQLGLITPLGTLGFVGPVVILGALAGRVDIKQFVVVGLTLTGLGLVLVGTAPDYVALLAFIAIQSAALGVVRALDRPILSHLHPENRGRVFTRQTMAWAVGATLGPFLVTAALAFGGWRWSYYLLGLAYLPVALFAWRLDFPSDVVDEHSFALADVRSLLGEPAIVGMALAIVIVGGLESTFFTWLTYYATGFLPRSTANLALSVYLAAYVPGRLGFSVLADRAFPPDVVFAAAATLVVVLAVLFGAGELAALPFFALTFAAGLFVSGFFPLLLTWGVKAAPSYTGPVNAVALVSAQVGFFVVPATVGFLAEAYSIGSAMLVQVVLATLLTALLGGRRVLGVANA